MVPAIGAVMANRSSCSRAWSRRAVSRATSDAAAWVAFGSVDRAARQAARERFGAQESGIGLRPRDDAGVERRLGLAHHRPLGVGVEPGEQRAAAHGVALRDLDRQHRAADRRTHLDGDRGRRLAIDRKHARERRGHDSLDPHRNGSCDERVDPKDHADEHSACSDDRAGPHRPQASTRRQRGRGPLLRHHAQRRSHGVGNRSREGINSRMGVGIDLGRRHGLPPIKATRLRRPSGLRSEGRRQERTDQAVVLPM